MWFSIPEHFRVMLYSLIMGIAFGFLYDFVKISRSALGVSSYSNTAKRFNSRHTSDSAFAFIIMLLGDVLYAVLCGMIYSLFLFHAIRGQVRWYFLLSSAVGFLAYYFTVSRFVLMITETLLYVVKIVLRTAFLPVRGIIKLLFRGSSFIKRRIIMRMIENHSYNLKYKHTVSVMDSITDIIIFE